MRRVLRVLATAVAVVVVLTAAYVGYAAWRHEQPVSLPSPTGSHAVSRMRFDWTDPARRRELSVWLWYPAVAGTGRSASYLPGRWSGLHLPSPVGWGETAVDVVRAHEREGARVAPGRFPLVVLLPGLGFSAPQYTATAVDLASRGYLVAGVTPTGSANLTVLHGRVVNASPRGNPRSFSGGHSPASERTADRLLRVWVGDARFAAARSLRVGALAGHVGRGRMYVGHSFGGAAAVQACHNDDGCAGAVDLDGSLFGSVARTGPRRPFLLVGSEGSCVTGGCTPRNADDRSDVATAHRMFARGAHPSWTLSVDGAQHIAFSDYSAYYLAVPLRRLLPVGSAERGRVLRVSDAYVAAFVARSLRRRGALLDEHPSPYAGAHLRAGSAG